MTATSFAMDDFVLTAAASASASAALSLEFQSTTYSQNYNTFSKIYMDDLTIKFESPKKCHARKLIESKKGEPNILMLI